nr:MAG TPA: hypothetical protein [Microviridae sp.]
MVLFSQFLRISFGNTKKTHTFAPCRSYNCY